MREGIWGGGTYTQQTESAVEGRLDMHTAERKTLTQQRGLGKLKIQLHLRV